MSKASQASSMSAGTNHAKDADLKALFIVKHASPTLIRLRELRAAFQDGENAGTPDQAAEAELDEAQDAFLERVPVNGLDLLEMLEVIAADNLWTTDDDDVPVRFDKFVTALKAYASKGEGESCPNWWECEEQLNVIGRTAKTLTIIGDACGHGAYTDKENVEESLALLSETLDGVRKRLHSLLHLPGWDKATPMRNDLSRRNVMATGVALELAALLSSVTTATVTGAEDWPEFRQWLAAAVALDAYYAETSRLWQGLSDEARHKRENTQSEEMDRLCQMAREISAKPALTDRHISMLVTLAVWSADKADGGNFDVTALIKPDDDLAEATSVRLLTALAPRAAAVLPEVPFVYSMEG